MSFPRPNLQNFVRTLLEHGNTPEWRPCPLSDFPVYEVSEDGQVRRVGSRLRNPILKPWTTVFGYLTYTLCYGGKKKVIFAHRLVCEAWHGPCPEGHECGHIDGTRTNNHYSNLRWVTRSENCCDKRRHQTLMSGERHERAILNWALVDQIRAEYTGRRGQIPELAKRYGVSTGCIEGIVHNRNWREVNRPKVDSE